jgi:hypothetical protein
MTANHPHTRRDAFLPALFCAIGFGVFAFTPAPAQNVGDWETVPGLTNGFWDNSTNNAAGNSNTWQMWTGSSWTPESGNVAGTGYPNNNSGVITILSGTTISNAVASASTTIADGIVVQTNASFQLFKSTFTLAHSGTFAADLDVFGTFGLQDSSAGGFSMNSGATIVVEPGASMTNFGSTSGDVFTGSGYGIPPVSYVPGAITFRSNSVFVLAATTNKGTIPVATWQPGSTCMIAPPSSNTTNFIPLGFANQTFYNLIWYWPTSNGKNGGSAEGGSFTVNGNFAMTANPNKMVTNQDIPYSGFTMTVVGNVGITNVAWYPTAAAGNVTINVGGNFSVDSTATFGLNNASAFGLLNFDGTSPQTYTLAGTQKSPANWNYAVSNGSTLNLTGAFTINGSGAGGIGYLTNNGTLILTTNSSLGGTSNTIIMGPGSTFDVSQGVYSFAAEDTLTGSGTVIGPVSAGSTSVIYPNSGQALTFKGTITYGSVTSTNIFNLTSSPSSGNDQIAVTSGGGVVANGAQIVINPVGTLSTNDYVLVKVTGGGSITGTFNTTPAWMGTPPANSTNYSIVTTATQAVLHYGAVAVPQPTITGVSISGTNLLLNGTNGVAGNYVVLMSTNLASKSWTPVATNALTGSGPFSIIATNAVNTSNQQQFYILQAP